MDLGAALNWLKLSPKYLSAIAIAIGIVLFAPDNFVNQLGMAEISENYKPWLGFGFILCIALLITDISPKIFNWIKTRLTWRRNLSKLNNRGQTPII